MNRRDELERAIALAHTERPDPLTCPECGCDVVVVEYRGGSIDDWIPVSCHTARTIDDACPVLRGGLAARRCYLDLMHALAPYVFLAHYGEPADTGLADAELAAL